MSGGITYRLMRYAIAGAVALTLGTQLLGAVSWAVVPWRLGNPLPVLMATGITLMLMYLTGLFDSESPQGVVLSVFAWIAAGYLAVVAFFLALPAGLLVSLLAGALTAMALSALGEERTIRVTNSLLLKIQARLMNTQGRREDTDRIAVVLPHESSDKIIRMVTERPRLEVAVTSYESCFVMLAKRLERKNVLAVVGEHDISNPRVMSDFFLESILSLPVLEEELGIMIDDYVFVSEKSAVECLLRTWPQRATLFPSDEGPVLVLRREDTRGVLSESIGRRERDSLIVQRLPQSLWNRKRRSVVAWD